MKKHSKMTMAVNSDSDEKDSDVENENSDFGDDWDLSKLNSVVANDKRVISDDESDNENISVKKQKLEEHLYKPPTAEELSQLRETENLFHSNLFRLQIEEVLNEVKFSDKYKKLFEAWFPRLKKKIELIPQSEEIKLCDEGILENFDTRIPFPKVPIETKGIFKFLKPSRISVIGSHSIDTIIGPNVVIDIAVEMPANMFQKGDYQNYRYLRKRAIYLSHIASCIDDSLAQTKSFVGNNEKVILKLEPNGKLGKRCIIHIHIAASENSFKFNRFLPEKNSIRPGWFFRNESLDEDDTLIPTPHYNSIILHDMSMIRANEEISETIKNYPNIRDGIILLKIWLKQRELNEGFNAFNGHIMAMYVLYLLHAKKINTFMSSYQIIRIVWNRLIESDWRENGISINQKTESLSRISIYHKYYDCVFLDTTGYHNLAANISSEMFSWIQNLAAVSIKSLDYNQSNSFQILFMRRMPIYRTFDNIICIQNTFALRNMIRKLSTKEDKLNFGPNKYMQGVKLIVDVLKKGLENRILDIFVSPESFREWSVIESMPEDTGKIFIGLNLNLEYCFNIITKGPEGNSPEAIAFRQFWGEKSELHRFKDTSIHEVVVWGRGRSLEEKRNITMRIIHYLFGRKLQLHKSKFLCFGNQLMNLLKLKKIKITNFEYGTGEEASLKVIQSFNALERELISLTDMPLSISGVQGISSVFRYTEVFPALATVVREKNNVTVESEKYLLLKEENLEEAPIYVKPIDVSINLLMSGKWPDELEAIQCMKGAFHIQIAECFRRQYHLKAEGGIHYTEVLKDGFIFRLRIANQKEIALMKQQVGEDGIIKYRDTEESIALEKKLFHLPKLNGALHGLHCQQPSFGPACCLVKRWLSSQLIDDSHFPEIVVELLLASIYLTPEPYKPTQMPQIGFLRLLELFARYEWNSDPVIVNFNNEMTREEIVTVENLFGSSRGSLPPLFIATPYDQQNSIWTRNSPSLLILNRICLIAKEALKIIETEISSSTLDHKAIFRPPLSEYDCLIYLKSVYNPRRYEAVQVDEKEPVIDLHPYKYHSKHKIPVVDFNPIQSYLRELREYYKDFALFFHDTYGGNVIAVLLKPAALEIKEFKVSNLQNRKINSEGMLVLDFSAMIENFYIMGKDIISEIDVQSKRVSIS